MFGSKKTAVDGRPPSYEEFAIRFPDHPAVQWVEERTNERQLLRLLSDVISSNKEVLSIPEVDDAKITELRLKLYGDSDA